MVKQKSVDPKKNKGNRYQVVFFSWTYKSLTAIVMSVIIWDIIGKKENDLHERCIQRNIQ